MVSPITATVLVGGVSYFFGGGGLKDSTGCLGCGGA
jgi:hypothetical protein